MAFLITLVRPPGLRAADARPRSVRTGELEFDDLSNPELDDVLDDLGAVTLKMGGEVVIVPTERMPTETGIAAIYRY
jgi:hypothetical protein